MTIFKDFAESQQKETSIYLNARMKQLSDLSKDWSDKAVKYLFVTNSGGAVATLSFIANVQTVGLLPKLTLSVYLLGLILTGILTAGIFEDVSGLFKNWRVDSESYLVNGLAWEELIKRDEQRSREKWWHYFIGYTSFGCFIIGTILGLVGLFAAK